MKTFVPLGISKLPRALAQRPSRFLQVRRLPSDLRTTRNLYVLRADVFYARISKYRTRALSPHRVIFKNSVTFVYGVVFSPSRYFRPKFPPSHGNGPRFDFIRNIPRRPSQLRKKSGYLGLSSERGDLPPQRYIGQSLVGLANFDGGM